jgi:hypothetical protein
MWRKIFGSAAVLIAIVGVTGYVVLVPGEADRPPPTTVVEPNLVQVAVPFTHRWSKQSSHPLLAAAAIDIDHDGRDEVFLGGSDGQRNALLAWRDGKLVDIAGETGLVGTGPTYGALSLDLDGDGKVDLITAGHAGIIAWLNTGGRFQRRPLDIKIPADGVPMAITAGDFNRDGKVDLYVSVFVTPKLFRSPVFNDPAHAKPNLLLRNDGDLHFTDVTDAVTGGMQNTFTASFVDLDRDGWLDLVLAQNTGEVEILRNLGNGTFARSDFHSGYGFWMGLAFGDIDQDGDLDLFLSNLGNSIPAGWSRATAATSKSRQTNGCCYETMADSASPTSPPMPAPPASASPGAACSRTSISMASSTCWWHRITSNGRCTHCSDCRASCCSARPASRSDFIPRRLPPIPVTARCR